MGRSEEEEVAVLIMGNHTREINYENSAVTVMFAILWDVTARSLLC
jgi:hypothetical protein